MDEQSVDLIIASSNPSIEVTQMIKRKYACCLDRPSWFGLCGLVTAAAHALEGASAPPGRAWLESLVLAILLGTAIRTFLRLDARFEPGIQIGAKLLLEVAVVLLGVSISASALLEHGIGLMGGIAAVVAMAIMSSFAIGRAFGLPRKMAILIACGNSICGNSAIAAVAPVIDADGDDVAAAIAFTAVLGVVVVLVLPLLVSLLSFSPVQFGVFAGLTVYAVPQVLAATSSVSLSSVSIGTLVKLARVLMLGPVVLVLSWPMHVKAGAGLRCFRWCHGLSPAFLLLLTLRSFGGHSRHADRAGACERKFPHHHVDGRPRARRRRTLGHARRRPGRSGCHPVLLTLVSISFCMIKLLGIA